MWLKTETARARQDKREVAGTSLTSGILSHLFAQPVTDVRVNADESLLVERDALDPF
jgi:hypothetical protein